MNSPVPCFSFLCTGFTGVRVCATVPGSPMPPPGSLQGRQEEAQAVEAEQRPHFSASQPGGGGDPEFGPSFGQVPPSLPSDPRAVRQLEALSLFGRQCVGCENEVFPPNNSKAGAKHCARSSVNTRAPPASSCPVQQGDSRGEEVPRHPHPAQCLSTVFIFPLPSAGSFRDLREQHFIPGQASSVLQ